MRLADAGRSQKQHRFAVGDEAARRELAELGPRPVRPRALVIGPLYESGQRWLELGLSAGWKACDLWAGETTPRA
jgi:hypothetical protein